MPEQPDIFVSYSRQHEQLVTPLVKLLALGGRLVFQDVGSLKLGTKWDDSIYESLDGAKTVIVIWCDHAGESEWVAKEARYAIDNEKAIIPVRIDTTPLPDYLTRYHGIDLSSQIKHKKLRTLSIPRVNSILLTLSLIVALSSIWSINLVWQKTGLVQSVVLDEPKLMRVDRKGQTSPSYTNTVPNIPDHTPKTSQNLIEDRIVRNYNSAKRNYELMIRSYHLDEDGTDRSLLSREDQRVIERATDIFLHSQSEYISMSNSLDQQIQRLISAEDRAIKSQYVLLKEVEKMKDQVDLDFADKSGRLKRDFLDRNAALQHQFQVLQARLDDEENTAKTILYVNCSIAIASFFLLYAGADYQKRQLRRELQQGIMLAEAVFKQLELVSG